MDIIKVFHGSDHIVKKPVYMGGRPNNDYGNGFYTTEYEDRARSWAVLNGRPERSIVNQYDLNLSGLKILDLNQCGILAWVAVVVANRGTNQGTAGITGSRLAELYSPDTEQADIIKGYRADDSYTQVIEAFLLNQINIAEVEKLFYKGSLGNQVFLKSEQAFSQITWTGSYEAIQTETDHTEDLQARREVNRFLTTRVKAILLDGFHVPGITAREAIQNQLHYRKEGYYENTGVR